MNNERQEEKLSFAYTTSMSSYSQCWIHLLQDSSMVFHGVFSFLTLSFSSFHQLAVSISTPFL
jgi:hypothetical protein